MLHQGELDVPRLYFNSPLLDHPPLSSFRFARSAISDKDMHLPNPGANLGARSTPLDLLGTVWPCKGNAYSLVIPDTSDGLAGHSLYLLKFQHLGRSMTPM